MTILPTGWVVQPLGTVAETALGKMLDRGRRRGYSQVPYLRNVNVQWERIDTTDLLTMELAAEERDRFGVKAGDLLVCEGGEIGRAAIWQGGTSYIAYQKALHRLRPSDKIDSRYLLHLFRHLALSGQLATHATGTTILHLPQQQLRRLPIPVPPIEEQRRIVDILEDHLSRLDAASAALDTTARRLQAWEAATLGECYATAERVPLASVTEIQGGIQKQPKRAPRKNAYPFLRVANVTSGGLDLAEVNQIELFDGEIDRLALHAGDLLVVEGNGSPSQIGRAAMWDGSIAGCVHQNHLIRVRAIEPLQGEFLEAVWNAPQNRELLSRISSSSSGLHTLSVAKLKTLDIPLPTRSEQAVLCARVSDTRLARRRLDAQLLAERQRCDSLRRSLLQAAFSGQLTGPSSNLDRVAESIG